VGLTTIYLIDGRLERVLGRRDPNVEAGEYGWLRGDGSSSNQRRVQILAVLSVLIAMLAIGRFGPTWSGARGLVERPGELLSRVFGEDPSAPYPMDYNFVGSVHYLAHARHRARIDGGSVEILLGVANEQDRQYSILTKRLAWPTTGYAAVEESFVELTQEGPLARRMVLRRGARLVLSYSWIERRGGVAAEWFRQAAALDRSPLARSGHMLAVRLSTHLGDGEAGISGAEERIRHIWERLAPELTNYASAAM
jgi:hypothetical protein